MKSGKGEVEVREGGSELRMKDERKGGVMSSQF